MINFILLGFTWLNIRKKKIFRFIWVSLALVFLISILAFISYLFGILHLNGLSTLTRLALPTSVLFLVLCIGIYQLEYIRLLHINFQRRLIAGFMMLALLLMIIFYLDATNDQKFIKNEKLTEHANQTLILTDVIVGSLNKMGSDIENDPHANKGQMMHLLDGGREGLFVTLGKLKNMSSGNLYELKKNDTLAGMFVQYFSLFEKASLLRDAGSGTKQTVENLSSELPLLTRQIRRIVDDIKNKEKSVLVKNKTDKYTNIFNANRVVNFFGVVILTILIVLLVIISRNTNARIKAEKETWQLAADLEKKGEERIRQLLQAEHQFRYTLDNMMEGAVIIGFDWCFTYVNGAMEQQCKMPRKELIGFTPMEKYPGFENTDIYKAIRYCLGERVSIQMESEFIFPDQ